MLRTQVNNSTFNWPNIEKKLSEEGTCLKQGTGRENDRSKITGCQVKSIYMIRVPRYNIQWNGYLTSCKPGWRLHVFLFRFETRVKNRLYHTWRLVHLFPFHFHSFFNVRNEVRKFRIEIFVGTMWLCPSSRVCV